MTREYNQLADEFANLMWEAEEPRDRLKLALEWLAELPKCRCDVIEEELRDGQIL